MSCVVGCRHSSDPALLWLWHRPVATAPIRPLVWEPPYAAGAALEKAKRLKKKKKSRFFPVNFTYLIPPILTLIFIVILNLKIFSNILRDVDLSGL